MFCVSGLCTCKASFFRLIAMMEDLSLDVFILELCKILSSFAKASPFTCQDAFWKQKFKVSATKCLQQLVTHEVSGQRSVGIILSADFSNARSEMVYLARYNKELQLFSHVCETVDQLGCLLLQSRQGFILQVNLHQGATLIREPEIWVACQR